MKLPRLFSRFRNQQTEPEAAQSHTYRLYRRALTGADEYIFLHNKKTIGTGHGFYLPNKSYFSVKRDEDIIYPFFEAVYDETPYTKCCNLISEYYEETIGCISGLQNRNSQIKYHITSGTEEKTQHTVIIHVDKTESGWNMRQLTGFYILRLPNRITITASRDKPLLYPADDYRLMYQMETDEALSDELALILLSYPLLEFEAKDEATLEIPNPNDLKTKDPLHHSPPPKLTHEIFYLDDQHNFVPEDAATKAVIRVTDENGNLVEEHWMLRNPTTTIL